jgi:hypothetical protein
MFAPIPTNTALYSVKVSADLYGDDGIGRPASQTQFANAT